MKITLFTFLLLITTNLKSKELKVVLLDSFICEKTVMESYKNVNIIAKTGTIKCKKTGFSREIHGDFVLRNFLERLGNTHKVTVLHFNVYNSDGGQNIKRWKEAFEFSKYIKADLIFTASTYIVKDLKKVKNLKLHKIPFLVASPTYGSGIERGMKLWPNDYFKKDLIKIADAIVPSKGENLPHIFNYALRDKLSDFYIPIKRDKNSSFGGSSKAVAIAAAKAINYCFDKNEDLRKCLLKRSTREKFSNRMLFRVLK